MRMNIDIVCIYLLSQVLLDSVLWKIENRKAAGLDEIPPEV